VALVVWEEGLIFWVASAPLSHPENDEWVKGHPKNDEWVKGHPKNDEWVKGNFATIFCWLSGAEASKKLLPVKNIKMAR
jgi:hypothetical protein